MNSEQFKRLCQDVASSRGALVTVGRADLDALITAKLAAWERIKYLENELDKLRDKLEDCTRIIENHDD